MAEYPPPPPTNAVVAVSCNSPGVEALMSRIAVQDVDGGYTMRTVKDNAVFVWYREQRLLRVYHCAYARYLEQDKEYLNSVPRDERRLLASETTIGKYVLEMLPK